MTPETTQHLNAVEGVIEKAKAILARHSYPDDLRSVVVMGTLTQIIEHHEAMLLVIETTSLAQRSHWFEALSRIFIGVCG